MQNSQFKNKIGLFSSGILYCIVYCICESAEPASMFVLCACETLRLRFSLKVKVVRRNSVPVRGKDGEKVISLILVSGLQPGKVANEGVNIHSQICTWNVHILHPCL